MLSLNDSLAPELAPQKLSAARKSIESGSDHIGRQLSQMGKLTPAQVARVQSHAHHKGLSFAVALLWDLSVANILHVAALPSIQLPNPPWRRRKRAVFA